MFTYQSIKYLQRIEKDLADNRSNPKIEIDYGYGWEYERGPSHLIITAERNETDKEYKKRLEREKAAKAAEAASKVLREEKERKEYERLKKKFG